MLDGKKKPTPALIINGSQADHLGLGSILVDVTVQINSLMSMRALYAQDRVLKYSI